MGFGQEYRMYWLIFLKYHLECMGRDHGGKKKVNWDIETLVQRHDGF